MSIKDQRTAQAFLLTVVSAIDDYACESVVEAIEVLSEDMNVPQAIGVIADGLFEMDKNQRSGQTSALLNQSMLYALWRVGLLASEPEVDGGFVRWTGFASEENLRKVVEQ